MKDPAFSVVTTTRTGIEAEMILSALRGAGFHPVELETASHISIAGTDISYHVEVPTTELAQAKEFLKEIQDSAPPASTDSEEGA